MTSWHAEVSWIGQGREFFRLFSEDRNKVHQPTRRIWDREKTATSAFDPSRLFAAQKACLAMRVFAGGVAGIRSNDAIPQ